MSAMRASVVIPCFNYGHHLAEAVESVLAQTLRGVEVIVVDDGSTDDSRAVAERLIAEHPDAAIRLITKANEGSPGATRNAGIAVAQARYVLCLDADDALHPGFLAATVSALDAHPDAAIAYGDQQTIGAASRLGQAPPWDTQRELDANFLGTASLFRREAWEQVGGIDPGIGYEDWDFWVGCIECGWVGVKAPGALWYYRAHAGGVYDGHLRRDEEIKARILRKHPSVYSEDQLRWAEAVHAGDDCALGTTSVGVMPPRGTPRVQPRATSAQLPIRSICLITKDYPPQVPGGIPRAVQMQAHMLAAAGVEVHVITKAHGPELVREDAGVVVHEISEPGLAVPPALGYLEIPLWSFVSASRFAALDASIGFDVVETPDYRGEALHLAPRAQTALVVWLHSTMMVVWRHCEPGYVRTPSDDAWHALEMAALERADLLLAPSPLLAQTTAELLGDRMRPVELMPYLFDASQFPARRREPGDGPIRILFYGRLEARKNPELALHAAAAARARGLDVELTFLGRDNAGYRDQVLAPLEVSLGFTGARYLAHAGIEELRAELAHTDVAILASRFDNSPLTIFESLSSGVPVITSDRVGTAGWFEPEHGLLALPSEDPAGFATRAAAAIADPVWMASGGRAAARMRELSDPECVTTRLLDC